MEGARVTRLFPDAKTATRAAWRSGSEGEWKTGAGAPATFPGNQRSASLVDVPVSTPRIILKNTSVLSIAPVKATAPRP